MSESIIPDDNCLSLSRMNGGLSKFVDQTQDPRKLIPELCRLFYNLGWVSGTGGGLSIRVDGRIYCAPSGVQKERIQPDDMFVLDNDGEIIERPLNPELKCSECLSLFMVPFKLRDAGCCIHSHSIHANLVTALYSKRNSEFLSNRRKEDHNDNILNRDRNTEDTRTDKVPCICCSDSGGHTIGSHVEFRISNQEMIKGIKIGASNDNFQYNDTLIVPIIDNVLHERDLAGAMFTAVADYPMTNAVLVRNHGLYVWGKTWGQAKSMAECYDYLFRLKIEAVKCGFSWMLQE